MFTLTAIIIILFIKFYLITSYKSVFLIHGLEDDPSIFKYAISYIERAHPGTVTVPIDALDDNMSLLPLWDQSKTFLKIIKNHPKYSEDGIHLVGFSQGGLIGRAVIELFDNHSIYNFISISSPQMGQYGTAHLDTKIPDFLKMFAAKLFYKTFMKSSSIGDMWHDPLNQDMYLKENNFLPVLNNQVNHSKMAEFKENFSRLRKVILIGGPDDGVICPWQSALFGFYDSNLNIVPMQNQSIYIEDSFGLRTLDTRKSLYSFIKENVNHHQWVKTESVIRDFVLPYLD